MQHFFGKGNREYWMGIAIAMVFLYHLLYPEWLDPSFKIIGSLFSRAEIGVDLFFFLSAYGLCHSYSNNRLSVFYKNRLKRLFPIYLVFWGVFSYFCNYSWSDALYRFLCQISGFACIQKTNYEWYVPSLIVLYLFFPLLFKLIDYLYRKRQISLYVILFFFSIGIGTLIFQQVFRIHFVKRFPVIILGIMSYLLERDKNEKKLVGLYSLAGLGSFFSAWYGFVPLVLYGIKYLPFKLIGRNFFCLLGRHSLEIYLAQHIAYRCYYIESVNTECLKVVTVIAYTVVLSLLFVCIQYGFWKIVNNFSSRSPHSVMKK